MDALTNIDAERTVLGCVLSEPNALYRALPLLSAEDFSLASHRRIFQAVTELARAGKPVDDLTLCNALGANSQLESVGGVAYVTTLTDNVDAGLARVTNIEHYASLLMDKSRRRKAHAAAQCLLARTEDVSVTTDEALQQIQEELLRIEATSGKSTARPVSAIMPDVLRELEAQATNQGLAGMSTGLGSLDLLTGAIRAGELWTVGALPGRGKTALGIQILLANGKQGIPCAGFSLEMQALEIGR